jgi:XTP/dITP diphosphohydrolase
MTSNPKSQFPSLIKLQTIVLGTHNQKKGRELQELLEPRGITVHTLKDFPHALTVEENGTTFAENAQLKAKQQAIHLGQWVLGEDSGLCVDALQGAPGLYSARFSGPNATDQRNNQHLLDQLVAIPDERRTAHYVSHLSLADPEGRVWIDCEATCQGRIRRQLAGTHGFGYDPLFEVVELHRTFGELGPAVKSVLSHRARAMRQFLRQLDRYHGSSFPT